MEAFILSAVEQGVMTITLNRPDRLNSFNDLMHHQLAECLKQAERDDGVRCLLITGAGRGFCAGQDLNDRNVDSQRPTAGSRHVGRTLLQPVSAPSGGAAEAGYLRGQRRCRRSGRYLALGCDIVLAARSAKFVMAFSKLGLVPDCGGSWFLPRVAGRARAMGLALLGDSLSAEQAAQWGMIWQLVDDSELADTSLQLARHLAAQPDVWSWAD
ncbi:enoyl-CoA hydratase-related protein [Klebsiella variicola subsp. variicola]|nr:enoyl-CoA hydratase-related protein [Klebsiella variicola subsp. variicola]